ncbi:MAG: TetR/AcrR family transcriptional regulator [Chloroflexota bacterium]
MKKSEKTRKLILDTADGLFAQHGYKSVSLRDIARTVDMKHTVIYYYVENKEDLYMQVMEQRFTQHQLAMVRVIEEAGDDLREQMQAVAGWLMAQTPTNMSYIMQSDLAELTPENTAKLTRIMFDALRLPLEAAFNEAQAKGVITTNNTGLAAISFVSLMQIVSAINIKAIHEQQQAIIDNTVDLLLNGLLAR